MNAIPAAANAGSFHNVPTPPASEQPATSVEPWLPSAAQAGSGHAGNGNGDTGHGGAGKGNGHAAYRPVDAAANGGRRPTISVVVPALNEQENIAWVLERMPAAVDEVVLVDGYSVDRTVQRARAARPDIVVVAQNAHGKGEALRAGFAAASSDIVVMIDADGSMDPAELYRFVMPLTMGYDFVKGSRFLAGGGSTDLTPLRRLGNRVLVGIANALFLIHFTDLCYGYCSFRRECLSALAPTACGFEIESELAVHAVKASLRIAEVPSTELPRRYGMSNLHAFRDGQRVLRTLIREWISRRPRPVVDPIDPRALYGWLSKAGTETEYAVREPAMRGVTT